MSWTFSAEAWRWQARPESEGGWVFVALPPEVADEVEEAAGPNVGGFGSVKVSVRVGTSSWTTSVFPDKSRATCVLPLKKAVRTRQGIEAGDTVEVLLDLL